MNVSNSELELLNIIWENEPLRSGRLVTLAGDKLGWKKSTVYTVVKHLVDKKIIKMWYKSRLQYISCIVIILTRLQVIFWDKHYHADYPWFFYVLPEKGNGRR